MKNKRFFRNLSLIMSVVFMFFGFIIVECIKLSIENKSLEEQLSQIGEFDAVELPVYEYTEEEVYLLAQCVEAEAGHYENHNVSQRYVTQVILNRVKSSEFPNSIGEVIFQKVHNVPQFSVAYNGMMNREVTAETLANVYSVLLYGTDLPDYVLYFYSDRVTNNWVNTLNTYTTIQGTVFAYS